MPENRALKAQRQRRYDASPKGRARHARRNARRIFVGKAYLGTADHYPAPREAIVQFARGLIEARKESIGSHG